MPLPLDPVKKEAYLKLLKDKGALRSRAAAENREVLKESKYQYWLDNAPFCKCGCGVKVIVNKEFGFKGGYKNYPYPEFLQGHNCRKIYQGLKLSFDEEQLILGSLLGDASLGYAHNTAAAPRLSMNHGSKQHAYVTYKATELVRLGAKVRVVKNGGYGAFNSRLDTPTLECLIPIYELMYLPSKRITKTLLDKLTPKAWAFWWLDDGSLDKRSLSGRLSTCSFSEQEHVLLKEYFYSFEIPTEIYFHKYFYLNFNKTGITKFINAINPHIPLGIMDYKFELGAYV